MHNNPDILTNVYRNDDWYMNRDRADQDDFFRESVFKYKLYEPGLLETDGICKVYFTCEIMKNCCHWKKRSMRAGATV